MTSIAPGFLLIILGALISEDLTCISVGFWVAMKSLTLTQGIVLCFLGIYIGDLSLYVMGRFFKKGVISLKLFKEADIAQAKAHFAEKGPAIIFLSRMIPGTRSPVYFTAGLLEMPFGMFAGCVFVAVTLWTIVIVSAVAFLGERAVANFHLFREYVVLGFLTAALVTWIILRLIVPLFTYRGRRLLYAAFKRLVRWEFWPAGMFYIPVVLYVFYLALRHRSLTLFTAANPGIPAGGFVGESKYQILKNLDSFGHAVARTKLILGGLAFEEKLAVVDDFLNENRQIYPVVLKPDVGQRGSGVLVAQDRSEVELYLRGKEEDILVQEYAPGEEFGIFYYRLPDQEKGRVFSITRKEFPRVTGDGTSCLEELILDDDRAVCMAEFYFKKNAARLAVIPQKGEKIQLIDIGSHCRGAVFYDGMPLWTEQMEEAIDKVSRKFKGFYFGRYDVRVLSRDDLRSGVNFKIIELNGVTAEATHIYDPKNNLFYAYRVLFEQWRILFEIGNQNRAGGQRVSSFRSLRRKWIKYRNLKKTRG